MKHVALVFPGMSYGHAYPLLHLSALTLEQVGATVERMTYPVLDEWTGQPDFWSEEREQRFVHDIRLRVRHELDRGADRFTLVGKSLGTHAMASLVDEPELLHDTTAVWLTPIVGEEKVFEAAKRASWRSLFIVGLADPAHQRERQAALTGELLELPGDHALQVDGDVHASVVNLQRVVDRLLSFVAD